MSYSGLNTSMSICFLITDAQDFANWWAAIKGEVDKRKADDSCFFSLIEKESLPAGEDDIIIMM